MKSRYRIITPYLFMERTRHGCPRSRFMARCYKRERQERLLADRTRWTQKGRDDAGDSMTYRVVILYERWMRVVSCRWTGSGRRKVIVMTARRRSWRNTYL
ncbi:MAG: hypothetical protein ACLU4N_05420 [Butyricimonas faecihominis]